MKQKIETENSKRLTDGDDREALMAQLAELKLRSSEMKKDFSQYEKCDPARLDSIKADSKICKEACDRWVDNIFLI